MVPTNTLTKLESSLLLELATSYDFSQELNVGVNNFLGKLVKYFELDFIGCWQKEDEASNNSTPIFVLPSKTKCSVLQNQDFFQYIEENDFVIINQDHNFIKEALELILIDRGNVLIFNTPFLIIYLYKSQEDFSEEEGFFLQEQINRFSKYVEFLFERNVLQEKFTALKTREKFLLTTEEESQKERLAVKNELLEAQSIMEIMFKNMKDGVFIYNYVEEQIIDFNDAAFRMFGYDHQEELLGLSRIKFTPQFSKYFPNTDIHEYTRGHGIKVCNGESIHKTLGIFVKKNQEHFFVEANVVPTHRKRGEAFIIFRDTTERFIAQKELKLRENKYRQIFENSHEGIVYFDIQNQKIVDCNHQALKLFDVKDKKVFLSSSFTSFFSVEKNEVKAFDFFKDKMNKAIVNGNSSFQFWAISINDKIFRAEANIIAEMGKKGVRKLVIFLRNITAKYNAEQELQAQHEKLKRYIESNMQLENFAYVASHDLQTPLRTIISFTQLLSRSLKEKMNPSDQEYMDFIIKATKNMQSLIHDLLGYSHINNTSIQTEELNVSELLKNLLKEMEFDLNQRKAIVNLPDQSIQIKADKSKLKQLFQNLITNALKFTEPEIIPIINISFEEKDTYWDFSVQDNGIGIEKEYQEKIFLLFKRLHGKDEYEGTGIGLAMCKKIVEQHQGEISLSSVVGHGTNFYFTIKKELNT